MILGDEASSDLHTYIGHYLNNMERVHSVERHDRSFGWGKIIRMFRWITLTSGRMLGEYRLKFDGSDLTGSGADYCVVDNFKLDYADECSIKHTLIKKEEIVVVPLTISRKVSDVSHACLLVFDSTTEKMHFFDPMGMRYDWMNMAFAGKTTSIVKGFDHASNFEDGWADDEDTIQYILDNNPYSLGGNCIIYSVLVGLLCVRFRIGSPRLVATAITDELKKIDIKHFKKMGKKKDNKGGYHMTVLWNWMTIMADQIKLLKGIPNLNENSLNTGQMLRKRNTRRREATRFLKSNPELNSKHSKKKVAQRISDRQREIEYRSSHPVLELDEQVDQITIKEYKDEIKKAESTILNTLFKPSEYCGVLLKTKKLCSARARSGDWLCSRHSYGKKRKRKAKA
ncbi:unnamed protein product, partial [Scytosiphon promiscuus]